MIWWCITDVVNHDACNDHGSDDENHRPHHTLDWQRVHRPYLKHHQQQRSYHKSDQMNMLSSDSTLSAISCWSALRQYQQISNSKTYQAKFFLRGPSAWSNLNSASCSRNTQHYNLQKTTSNSSISKTVPWLDVDLLWLLDFLLFTCISFHPYFSVVKRWSFNYRPITVYNYELFMSFRRKYYSLSTI